MAQKFGKDSNHKSTAKKSETKVKAPGNFPVWIAALVFAATTTIFFWGQLSGKSFFWEDFTEFVYPTQSFAASQSAAGEIPFWNPYTFAGMPFFADLQVGFFYPFNRLLTFFVNSDGSLPVWILQFMIILHYFIAQSSMFYLSRSYKISSYGSLIASVSYAFSLILVCHTIHPMIVYHLAWFPLVVMFFRKGLMNRDLRSAVLAGIIFGISMLSGHPQLTLYEAFFLGLLALWYFIASLKKKELNGKSALHFGINTVLPLLIAAGIFCIQYLPSQELAGLSQRAEMGYEKASEGSLEYKQILTAIVPKLFGASEGSKDNDVPYHLEIKDPSTGQPKYAQYYNYWESAFYFGIATLILALFGAFNNYKNREVLFLISVSIFGLLYSLGSNFPIFQIFYHMPFFGTFRNPARMMLFQVFSMTLLAGIGFDFLWQNPKMKKTMSFLVIASAIPLLLSFLVSSGSLASALNTPEKFRAGVQAFGTTSLLFSIFAIIILFLQHKAIIKPAIGGILVLLVVFIDLYSAGSGFNQGSENPANVYQIDGQMKSRFKPSYPENIFRVNMRMYNPSYQAMQRNQGMIDRLMLVEGYNPLILKKVIPPINSRDTVNALYNVKYEIGINPEGRPQFVERTFTLPRAWMVHQAVVLNENQIEAAMRNNGYDYKQTVVLESNPNLPLQADAEGENVKCLDYSSNSFKYQTISRTNGILCFSEIWYPAWKAYVDGKKVDMLRANYCFRAVAVPAGSHIVEMKYESASFSFGSFISIFTILASAALMLITSRKKTPKD